MLHLSCTICCTYHVHITDQDKQWSTMSSQSQMCTENVTRRVQKHFCTADRHWTAAYSHTWIHAVHACRQTWKQYLHTIKLVHCNPINPNFPSNENLVNKHTQSQSIGAMFFLTGDLHEPKPGTSSPAASNILTKGSSFTSEKTIDADKWWVIFSPTVQFTYVNTI